MKARCPQRTQRTPQRLSAACQVYIHCQVGFSASSSLLAFLFTSDIVRAANQRHRKRA